MNEQQKWDNLLQIRDVIEKPVFQEMIVEPMREYQAKLEKAYDCKSLTELATVKGKKEGSEQFFKVLKEIATDFKNTKDEIESSS